MRDSVNNNILVFRTVTNERELEGKIKILSRVLSTVLRDIRNHCRMSSVSVGHYVEGDKWAILTSR